MPMPPPPPPPPLQLALGLGLGLGLGIPALIVASVLVHRLVRGSAQPGGGYAHA